MTNKLITTITIINKMGFSLFSLFHIVFISMDTHGMSTEYKQIGDYMRLFISTDDNDDDGAHDRDFSKTS